MKYFSNNGVILPINQATIPLSSVEYSYGFGVYETIRVSAGHPYFLEEHIDRLARSAEVIGLEHPFSSSFIAASIIELIQKNKVAACNIKVLLIGAQTKQEANIHVVCLRPLFPDRKLYKTGAHVISYNYERMFPQAKTLNMLPSYLAYRHAKTQDAYDALLVNRKGYITEGTRTNFFCIKGTTIVGPPEAEILPGVTRSGVLKVAVKNGYDYVEKNVSIADIADYDGAFITSTSSKIVPLKSIDELRLDIPQTVFDLIQLFNAYLKDSTR